MNLVDHGFGGGPWVFAARLLANPFVIIVGFGPSTSVYAIFVVPPTDVWFDGSASFHSAPPGHPHFPYGWEVEPDQ